MAFSMGTDCPDVCQVIHYGSPDNIEANAQETGRIDHDGFTTVATMVVKPTRKKPNKQMSNYISNTTICRRVELFNKFDKWEMSSSANTCTCCDICNDLTETSQDFVVLN